MPRKAKAAPRRKARGKPVKPASPELTREEVLALEEAALRSRKAERTWRKMSDPAPAEDDGMDSVEERLVSKENEDRHSARRWKYFSK